MSDRDKIAEIIREARINAHPLSQLGYPEADALIANGVIVPPCKVGDVVYFIQGKKVYEGTVILIRPFIHKDNTTFHGNVEYECEDPFYHDGRMMKHQVSVVFQEYGQKLIAYLTKEEAEKALAGRKIKNG